VTAPDAPNAEPGRGLLSDWDLSEALEYLSEPTADDFVTGVAGECVALVRGHVDALTAERDAALFALDDAEATASHKYAAALADRLELIERVTERQLERGALQAKIKETEAKAGNRIAELGAELGRLQARLAAAEAGIAAAIDNAPKPRHVGGGTDNGALFQDGFEQGQLTGRIEALRDAARIVGGAG
jgi:microcompartment protein CcmL/EutN